jgi:hypothetical protein
LKAFVKGHVLMGVFSELELWYFLASSTGIDQAKSKSSGE